MAGDSCCKSPMAIHRNENHAVVKSPAFQVLPDISKDTWKTLPVFKRAVPCVPFMENLHLIQTGRTLPVLAVLLIGVVVPGVRAEGFVLGFFSGYVLSICAPLGCASQIVSEGTGADIVAYDQSMVKSSETLAYWVSLDYWSLAWGHQWVQAGYIAGNAPDGKFYCLERFYVEYNLGGTYYFSVVLQPAVPLSVHTFRVWVDSLSNWAYMTIDGVTEASFQMPVLDGFQTGQSEAMLEAHQGGSSEAGGKWTNLVYLPDALNPSWTKWGDPPAWPDTSKADGLNESCQYTYWLQSNSPLTFIAGYGNWCAQGGGQIRV